MIGLKQSLAVMLAGEVGSGKTRQIESAFNVCLIDGQTGETYYPFRPAFFLATGGDGYSAAGTASDMVTHPECLFLRGQTVEEALRLMREKVKEGHRDQPFRLVAHDSWSSFRDVAADEVRDRAVKEADGGKSLRGQARKNIANNPKDIHSFARGDIANLVKAYFEAGAGLEPRLLLSTCHTDPPFGDEANPRPFGQYLRLSRTIVHSVHGGHNVIWHLAKEDPDCSRLTAEQVNAKHTAGELAPRYFAYTAAGTYKEPGLIQHAKTQGSHGALEIFGRHAPRIWESPDLGYVLAHVVAALHGRSLTVDEQGRYILG